MKLKCLIMLSLCCICLPSRALASRPTVEPEWIRLAREIKHSPREHISFNGGWKRFQGHCAGNAITTDDTNWQCVDLSDDSAINGTRGGQSDGATGKLKHSGPVWYRKHFECTDGQQVYLDIEGAMPRSKMWLNSHLVAGRPYGHSSFRVDLTPFVQPQKDNVIAIRVNSRPESSRWSAGGGYRCWLTETSPIHVENTVVSTQIVTDKSTNVDVQVNARNDSTKDSRVDVFNEVFTIDGNDRRTHFVCSNNQFNYMLTRGKPTLFTSRFELDEASLWDTVHPRRYVVATRIEIHGQVMDTYDTIFGTSIGKIEPSAWKLP